MPRKKTLEEIKQNLYDMYEDRYTVLSTVYNGSNYPLKLRCNIHNTEFSEKWNRVNMGRINCEMCKILKYKKSRTKTSEQYKQECIDRGLDLPLEDYKGAKVKIKHICKYKHIYEQTPNAHLNNGRRCTVCYDTPVKTPEEYKQECIDKGLDLPVEDYINSSTPIFHKCNACGCVYKQAPGNHLYGQGCPPCRESRGEKHIRIYLDKHCIKYIPQNTFEGLKDKKSLSYDFYLPDYDILIEYQGIQHFKSVSFNGKDYTDLDKQKRHDRIKQRFAKDNGYKLLRPTYKTDTQEKINKYLDRYLVK